MWDKGWSLASRKGFFSPSKQNKGVQESEDLVVSLKIWWFLSRFGGFSEDWWWLWLWWWWWGGGGGCFLGEPPYVFCSSFFVTNGNPQFRKVTKLPSRDEIDATSQSKRDSREGSTSNTQALNVWCIYSLIFQNPPVIPWVWRCERNPEGGLSPQEVCLGSKWHLLRRCLDD